MESCVGAPICVCSCSSQELAFFVAELLLAVPVCNTSLSLRWCFEVLPCGMKLLGETPLEALAVSFSARAPPQLLSLQSCSSTAVLLNAASCSCFLLPSSSISRAAA